MLFRSACHGAEGKGNPVLGAPDLTANVWMYGSSEASIVETILNGRENIMPAQKGILTEDQIRMLTAWVWGLSNSEDSAQYTRYIMSSNTPGAAGDTPAPEQIPAWQPPRVRDRGGSSPQVEKALSDVRSKIHPRSVKGLFNNWRIIM